LLLTTHEPRISPAWEEALKFEWITDAKDERAYRDFVARWRKHKFVTERTTRNIQRTGVDLSLENFWRRLAGCLFTTQQQSGENSKVAQFLQSNHPLLDWNHCRRAANLAAEAEKALSDNGLRRGKRVGAELALAARFLNGGAWTQVNARLRAIAARTSKAQEREVARFLQDRFKGIGPKQSRNLIQSLGLSKYEVPLDSRMVKVLRSLRFPVPLSAKALGDEDYYCFIEDGLQDLLARINIYPCIFDACVFASMERARKKQVKR
jgi:hypothetical protein